MGKRPNIQRFDRETLRKMIVVHPGGRQLEPVSQFEGPVTRLGVRREPFSKKQIFWLFAPKFLLLSVVLYYWLSA